jgi:hypothetical protein
MLLPVGGCWVIVQIESDTNASQFYSVNVAELTCSCPFFLRELTTVPFDDPRRLCKHLTQALTKVGVPESLAQYRADIERCGAQRLRFGGIREMRPRKPEWPEGSIATLSVERKTGQVFLSDVVEEDRGPYFHVHGKVGEESIEAALQDTLILYSVNGSRAYTLGVGPERKSEARIEAAGIIVTMTMDFNESDDFPRRYKFMEKAVLKWLRDEHARLFSGANTTPRS